MIELTKQKYLSDEERAALEKLLTKYQKSDFRSTTFIWTLLHTGARVSEVLAIRRKDLLPGMSVHVVGLKSSRDREIPFAPFLFNRLKVLSEGLGEDDLIFDFSYSTAKRIWNFWKPCRKRIHSLRHTRAIEVYRKTRDILLVKRLLGHRSLSSTMVYAEYEIGQDEMRRALLV